MKRAGVERTLVPMRILGPCGPELCRFCAGVKVAMHGDTACWSLSSNQDQFGLPTVQACERAQTYQPCLDIPTVTASARTVSETAGGHNEHVSAVGAALNWTVNGLPSLDDNDQP